ncbi:MULTISPECIES: alpha/beta fold hydrolase [unclassified Streptomyces]|uniref:alpha/beta fold hydrolase n=1 Tax=unclassified Streptomyces TaxID=2593676 RepID=UPI00038229F5|nr:MULTISPECIES: alpha/beta fold hydrolase [unclassified Streptomyces]MYT32661.1 alpha/beta fold hydrolase [Streptomyces sp. SID8354]
MTTYRQPGTVLTDHTFSVPLDHSQPDGERIEVYAREVVAASREGKPLPWLVFLQGGPGGRSPRPLGRNSWLARALDDYRVLLLDQRGTGSSTPANRQTLPQRGDAAAQAAYLAHFRADSIVADCELIRRQLVGQDVKWSLLGQSYGGKCILSYLSFAPQGLREAFISGGLPSISASPQDVYRAAYPRAERKSEGHYARYPQDVATAREIAQHLRDHEVRLPDGGLLTSEAFQALGVMLGMNTGSHKLHYLLEDAFLSGPGEPRLSDSFLYEVQRHLSRAFNPLHAVLLETSYAQRSVSPEATGWAAQTVREEFPQFDVDKTLSAGEPLLFTGEMIYPWMFSVDPALAPLQGAAHKIAWRQEWPDLYSAEQLAHNDVPVAAVVYHDDMYVDPADSLATARIVKSLRTWITNEYEHDGLGVSGGRVLDRMIKMVRGVV